MKRLITPVVALFFGVCTSFAQENTAEKATGSNNGKSIDCHLKLDGVKGESTHAKKSQVTTQEGDIEYAYKPQKAAAPSGDNSSTEDENTTEANKKPKHDTVKNSISNVR
jgi:hypothetical protein